MKKNIFIFSTIVLAFTLQSCEDLLKLDPVSSLVYGSFWTSEESARVAMIGLHATMRERHMEFHHMGELRSDLYGGANGLEREPDESIPLIYNDIRTDNAPYENWAYFYTDLHYINDAIKNIPNIEFASQNEKNYLIGQAYGMRAYYYYTMLRTWGGVPIVTEPTESLDLSQLQKPRGSKQDVMDLIKSDLKASLDAFGDMNHFQNNSRRRWSRAASLMLKADVYIWSGTHHNGGTADYTEAKLALEKIIGNSNFDLLSDFSSVFKYKNKNNKEIIFAYNFENNEATNGMGRFQAKQAHISTYYDYNGVKFGSALSLNGSSGYHPSEDRYLAVLFEDYPLDSRADATWIRVYKAPGHNEADLVAAIGNKFMGDVVAGLRVMIDDKPVYRYAYALLLLAEAKNLLGEDPSNEINLIRKRAYGANFNPDIHTYVNQSKEKNTEAILKEGLKEMGMEGVRWWDLRRAGDAYVFKHNKYFNPGDEYKLLLPITREMIGRNPALEQTPGYTN